MSAYPNPSDSIPIEEINRIEELNHMSEIDRIHSCEGYIVPDHFDPAACITLPSLGLGRAAPPAAVLAALQHDTVEHDASFWTAPFPPADAPIVVPTDLDFPTAVAEQRSRAFRVSAVVAKQLDAVLRVFPAAWSFEPDPTFDFGPAAREDFDMTPEEEVAIRRYHAGRGSYEMIQEPVLRRLEDLFLLAVDLSGRVEYEVKYSAFCRYQISSASERERTLVEMYRIFLQCGKWLDFIAGKADACDIMQAIAGLDVSRD